MGTTSEAQKRAVRKYEKDNCLQLAYRIDKDLITKVRAKAEAESISVRSIVAKALEDYLNN